MKKRVWWLICIAFMTLMGCGGGMGNKQISDQNAVSKIQEGKSTKDDVRAAVGHPTHVGFNETTGSETWTYMYQRSDVRGATFVPVVGWFAGGVDTSGNSLTVLFDKKGVVQKYGYGKTSGGVGGVND